MSGQAFLMKLDLQRLMQRHGVASSPVALPLAKPVDGSSIITGVVSTSLDLERAKFRLWCFPIIPWSKDFVPLLWKHNPAEVAGEIESLEYDTHGQLKVSARVDHPLAKRVDGISVSATVRRWASIGEIGEIGRRHRRPGRSRKPTR